MNEQYLFRGKWKDNGEWVEGDLMRWNDGTMRICVEDGDDSKITRTVIPETIGQCTGTLDKNGKFVFGGDIVKAYKHNETPYTEAVTFRDGCFWFGGWNWVEFLNVFRNIEVIGNIHDNKDLLEVQNG